MSIVRLGTEMILKERFRYKVEELGSRGVREKKAFSPLLPYSLTPLRLYQAKIKICPKRRNPHP